ncbi:MAG: hypothetical protein RL139_374 [Gemmatimonadota bacterium]|jgi:cyclomaltodextrinase / maltogenic alpha-amylase / neopullulanase
MPSLMHRAALAALTALFGAALRAPTLTAQTRPDVSGRDARPSADWVRDAVIYELNVRTFTEAGTFAATTARLPELRDLGVTVLWLMPIHPLGEVKKKGRIGSPYAVQDYYAVNQAYGTVDDLRRLVREAHRLGLKVILDVVLNHTAWDNPLLRRPGFHKRDAAGNVLSPYDWTDIAQLDYGNRATRDYMFGVLEHWMREVDLDGYRADVAFLVPTDFWEEARTRLERLKPEVMMLAESHEPDLVAKAFDLDYGWPGYHALKDAIQGTRSARAIREEWEAERRIYPRGALHMRIADDHDESRAVSLFGTRGALAASALIFALDGVPVLYNGMEVGDATESGAPALFEDLPVFWGVRERRPEFPRFYAQLLPFRRAHAALRRGSTTWVRNADEDRIVTFVRQDAAEEILVAVNLSNRPFHGTVEVGGTSYVDVTPWREGRPGADAAEGQAPAALPALTLEAWGVRLFRRAR